MSDARAELDRVQLMAEIDTARTPIEEHIDDLP